MLSHVAFQCTKEKRSCPLRSVGCTEVHSVTDADATKHMNLLLKARVSGAFGVSKC